MKKLVALFSVLFTSSAVFGQTNPAAVNLPINYTLNDLASNSTVYPAGMQGWSFSRVLDQYFPGQPDEKTLALLKR